jgi:benzoyl-CoA reductase/2-hydroxyglutaryl-CoA dehydratase subunit BcrC/BadD/HgdB
MAEARNATIPQRQEVIRAHKDAGGGIAAVFPIHYPRALLRAFGLLPMEVWGPPRVDVSHGAAHLQPYVCSIVRNALSFLLTGGLDVADVLVVPHACDSLQGLGSILIDFVQPRHAVLPLYLPRSTRPSDLDFLTAELRAMHAHLQDVTSLSPTDERLQKCIALEEEADARLAALHARRATLGLTGVGFYRLARSREYLPAEEFTALAQQALDQPPAAASNGLPLLLSGIVPEPIQVLEALDRLGAVIFADDFACSGRRLYPAGRDADPFRRMAKSLIGGPPDCTRGSPIADRLRHLTALARRTGARGVIFYDVKFCEPELFDLPSLRAGLQGAGVPSTSIEVDLSDPFPEQALTRIEAFLEMIA